MTVRKVTVTGIILAGLLGSTSLVAQDANTSVSQRSRADYDAPGVTSGSFYMFPTMEASATFDNNIYALDNNKVDDFLINVKPGLRAQSNWNRHTLRIYANGDFGFYNDNSSEDYEDFNVGFDGQMDVGTGSFFTAGLNYSGSHEDRGSPDSPGAAAEYTSLDTLRANFGYTRDVSVVSLSVFTDFAELNYDDAAIVGGGVINNDDRDREELSFGARVGYEIGENTEAYVRVTSKTIEYKDSKQDGGPNRDSDGYEAVVGATLDVTGKTTFDAYAGYVKREYRSHVLDDISDATFGMSLLWNPSQMTSVISRVSRQVTETSVFEQNTADVFVPVSGILNTSASLTLEHELRRNVIVSGGVNFSEQKFKGTVRSDDVMGINVGAQYLLNRNFRMGVSYSFEDKSSNVDRGEYDRSKLMFNVTAAW